MFNSGVGVVLGVLHAIAATVLLYIMVLPKKKDGKLNAFLQQVHNFFNVKKLYLEEVLKFLYVLSSMVAVCVGFFMMLSYQYSYWSGKEPMILQGLLVMILGPVVLRLVYEGVMMFILLVKNTMEINNNLKATSAPEAPAEPVACAAEAPAAPEFPQE